MYTSFLPRAERPSRPLTLSFHFHPLLLPFRASLSLSFSCFPFHVSSSSSVPRHLVKPCRDNTETRGSSSGGTTLRAFSTLFAANIHTESPARRSATVVYLLVPKCRERSGGTSFLVKFRETLARDRIQGIIYTHSCRRLFGRKRARGNWKRKSIGDLQFDVFVCRWWFTNGSCASP